MMYSRDQVDPEGAGRGTDSRLLKPFVPTVRPPSAPVAGERLTGSSIFANQGYFYAQCRKSDVVGNCVFANSTEAFVSTADEASPSPVIGIIVAKSADDQCTVQRYGQSLVDFEGLIPGKRYFLGPSGSIITPPFDDEMPEYVQQVGNAISTTSLFIQPTGQVIKRIINRDFVLSQAGDPPKANTDYARTDVYIDRVNLEAYLSPTVPGEDSIILVGNGPPTDQQVRNAQAVYRDADGNLYFSNSDDAVPTPVSALIFGVTAPTGSERASNNVFFIENDTFDTYPRTNVTGAT